MILKKEEVKKCFEASDQGQVLINLYKLVFPEWEIIKQIDGFPEVGEELDVLILDLFVKFDRETHPGILPGGIWINSGFSLNRKLKPFEVRPCQVIYAE